MAYLIFYIVFIASSSSLVCILASCLPFFFGVGHYTFKNKVGNVLNNTQDQNDSNDWFGLDSLSCEMMMNWQPLVYGYCLNNNEW